MKNQPRNRQTQRKSGPKGQKMNLRSRGMKGPAPDAPKRAYGAKSHGATAAPRSPKTATRKAPKNRRNAKHEGGSGWIYGSHACRAALANPRRTIHELLLTESAANRLNLPCGGVVPQMRARRKMICRMFCTAAPNKSSSWARKAQACVTACAKPAINFPHP